MNKIPFFFERLYFINLKKKEKSSIAEIISVLFLFLRCINDINIKYYSVNVNKEEIISSAKNVNNYMHFYRIMRENEKEREI